jgi:7,8-dihydropterin-6-yl-methyl-4-(beta-D-ribofuranosyl)aminobenzene 5'-phosphate synthase
MDSLRGKFRIALGDPLIAGDVMTKLRMFAAFLLSLVLSLSAIAHEAAPALKDIRVTILSTMVAEYAGENELTAEWGFSALVEAGGRRILFDTGAHPDTVLRNAQALGVDLSSVTDIVLSHFHDDHTGGLVALRAALRVHNPHAMERAHVGHGYFFPRQFDGKPYDGHVRSATRYRDLGGSFVEHAQSEEIAPGVWVSGSIPRITDERNFPRGISLQLPNGKWVDDEVPDDLALVLKTSEGPVILTGCGHAGIVNILRFVKDQMDVRPVAAVIGGLHLFAASDERVDWTGSQMKEHGVRWLLAAHCTGLEAVPRLRASAGLDRKRALQGAVGASFTLAQGIDPGPLGLTR